MTRGVGVAATMLAMMMVYTVATPRKEPEPGQAGTGKEGSVLKKGQQEREGKTAEPCADIANRLRRFLKGPPPKIDMWALPDGCRTGGKTNGTPVTRMGHVQVAVAIVPNPVSTHLPLFFDRLVEVIQQAAQDEQFSYDGSWFPWQQPAEYVLFEDRQKAEEASGARQKQPGVMVFRGSTADGADPYENGLIVFLAGEQPTGGIYDDQFDNALRWIQAIGGFSAGSLRVLGPTFSGSLPSLKQALDRIPAVVKPSPLRLDIYSGGVSSGS